MSQVEQALCSWRTPSIILQSSKRCGLEKYVKSTAPPNNKVAIAKSSTPNTPKSNTGWLESVLYGNLAYIKKEEQQWGKAVIWAS